MEGERDMPDILPADGSDPKIASNALDTIDTSRSGNTCDVLKEKFEAIENVGNADPELYTMIYNDETVYQKQLQEFLNEEKDSVKCNTCDYITDDTRKMKRHTKISHRLKIPKSNEDNLCPPCNKPFSSKDKLDDHIRDIHLKLKLSCNQCKFESLKRIEMVRHVRKEHGKVVTSSNSSKTCGTCQQVFKNNRNLQRHVRVLHKKELPYACEKCEYKAGEERQLLRHVKRVHDGLFESEARQTLKCPKCDYTTNWGRSKIKNHIKTVHDKIKDFQCPSCEFCCSQRGNLRLHVEQVHNKIRKFSCTAEGCQYKSNFKNDITKHSKTVHGTLKDISCHLCGYQTAVQGYLTVHMKNKHGLKKNYLCPHCGKQFHVFRNFHKHIKVLHPFEALPVRKKDPTQIIRRKRTMFNKQSSIQPLKVESSPIKSDKTEESSNWKIEQKFVYKLEVPKKRVVNGKTYQQCKCPEPDCSYTTLWGKNHLSKHIKAVHQKVKDVTCDQCEYTACQNVHMSTHLKLIHLTCYQCHQRFWDNLKEMASCSSCEVKFPLRRHLVRHVKAVHPDEPLPCKAISVEGKTVRIANEKEFESEFGTAEENREKTKYYNLELERLKEHIKKSHPVLPKDQSITDSCPECSYKTQDKSRLRAHIKEVHRQIKDFLCELCSYKTSKKSNLASHILRQHEGVKIPRKKRLGADGVPLEHGHKILKCSYCKERCDGRTKFEEHIKTMHSDASAKRLVCPHCIFTAKKVYALNRHIKAVHYKIKDQNCEQCSFTTTDKSTLTKHVKAIHMGMKGVNHKGKKFQTDDSKEALADTVKGASPIKHDNVINEASNNDKLNNVSLRVISSAHFTPPIHVNPIEAATQALEKNSIVVGQISVPQSFIRQSIVDDKSSECSTEPAQPIIHYVSQNKVSYPLPKPYQPRKKEAPIIDPTIQIVPEIIEFEQQEKKAFSCSQCRFQSNEQDELDTHFKKEHEKTKNLPCTLCSYVTWNKYNLRRHIQNCHAEKGEKLSIPLIEMKCSQCSYQFSIRDIHSRAQSRLNRHVQEVHGSVKDIHCTLCNYQTKRKSNLEAHMNRIHTKKKKEQEGEKNDSPAIIQIPDAIVIGQPEAIPSIQKLGDQTFITPSTTYFIQDGY